MAFDPDLADQLENALRAHGADPVRKRMFGGIGFIVDGHMALATRETVFHARVGRERQDAALERPGVEPMVAGGRPMTGWVTVEGGLDLDDEEIADWAGQAMTTVRALPPK